MKAFDRFLSTKIDYSQRVSPLAGVVDSQSQFGNDASSLESSPPDVMSEFLLAD
jgi:hypothetical protein